ncbi:MAG TPA: DNA ligase D [Gammaproteobacteria bacterium]
MRRGLEDYHRRRDFDQTPEPEGRVGASNSENLSYLIQKHEARRPHYDFRLELDGVLLSWAIPKGPSLDPDDKRFAVRTEDHPLDYGGFEGVIPKGEYGGGTVMLWDRGRWEPKNDPHEGLRKGNLSFNLHGERLKGGYGLIRIQSRDAKDAWLLIKSRDDQAQPGQGGQVVERHLSSVHSGRTMEEIAGEQSRVWTRAGELPTREELLELSGAVDGEVPLPVIPQLPTLVQQPVKGEDWLHELKLDGYRLIIRVREGRAEIFTRSGQNWTEKLYVIADAAARLPIDDAVIDGELVAMDAQGRSSFGALQRAIGEDPGSLYVYAFDLLQARGVDLREVPLRDRKEVLRRIVPAGQGRVRYGDHVVAPATQVLAEACRLDAEGIVSKRLDAPYRSGHGRDWVKMKCLGREEFLVGGYVSRKGNSLASLLLGRMENGGLEYVGRVGTGFNQDDLREIAKRLEKLPRRDIPFAGREPPVHTGDSHHWVDQQLMVEVHYSGWTDDGVLRHASFQGIREDKPPPPRGNPDIRVSNPDKVFYPEIPLTKGQLAAWTGLMAPWILPHVVDRPLLLLRCPNGYKESCFFQKHHENMPSRIHPVQVPGYEEPYILIRDIEGLIALVQAGTLEIHPWGSRADRLDRPDRMIFDLDPDAGLPFEAVVYAARDMRDRLERLGMQSWVRWTGGKGLHVVVPLVRRHDWGMIREFSRAVAEAMVRDEPKRFVATSSKEKRKGKIFIDWLRNGFGSTAIASWCCRARPGAPVAVPLSWSALDPEMDLTPYRVSRLRPPAHDPWSGFFEAGQTVTASMRRQVGIKGK